MELFEGIPRSVSEGYKVWISLAAVILALAWVKIPALRRRQALVALTLVAALNYSRWGYTLWTDRVDTYDLIHYYLNSKYFDELGYYDLYPAVILVDHENGGPVYEERGKYMAQDDSGHHTEPIEHALARGEIVKNTKFTPELWAAFTHDSLVLQREIVGFERDPKQWFEMINDHGFNGTTAWTVLAEPIADVVPVEYVKVLGYIDVVMLGGAVALVGWAYGLETSLWVLTFLFLTYSGRWPTYSWAFLRYDYLAAMLGCMALLRKGYPLLGGVLAGWSASLRLFPAMYMWGPFAKGIVGLAEKRVHKSLLILAGGFLLGVAGIEAAAIARYGTDPIEVHLENMSDHNDSIQLSSRRIGLALALSYNGHLEPKRLVTERKYVIEAQKPLRYGLSIAILVIMGYGMRRLRDDEAYGFGFIPFFLITTASYYYYVTRATLSVLHAAELDKLRNRVGLAMLFGMEMFSNWAETSYTGYRMFLIGYLSWFIAAYAVAMMLWTVKEAREKLEVEAA